MLSPLLIDGDPVRTLYSNATLDFIGGSSGRPWYARDRNNLAPHVGLAWDIFGTRKLVFRSGYSLHYVNDEHVRSAEAMLEYNPGVRQFKSDFYNPPVPLSSVPQITPPEYRVPLTFSEAAATNNRPVFTLLEPQLRTPYVQGWSAGFEHERARLHLRAAVLGKSRGEILRVAEPQPA